MGDLFVCATVLSRSGLQLRCIQDSQKQTNISHQRNEIIIAEFQITSSYQRMCFLHRPFLFHTVNVCVNYKHRNTLVSLSFYKLATCVYRETFNGTKGGQYGHVSLHTLGFMESTGVRWNKYGNEPAEMEMSFVNL
jgi:hypothetical protein